MEGPLVGRGVAEKGQGDLLGAPELGGVGRASGDGDFAAHNAVGAQDALVHGHDVHGAALALGVAGLFSQDLGHHPVQIGASGHQVAVAAVGGADVVVLTQSDTRPGGHRLLPQIQVRQAWHQAPLIELKDLLLEAAHPVHYGIELLCQLLRFLFRAHIFYLPMSVDDPFSFRQSQRITVPPLTSTIMPVT